MVERCSAHYLKCRPQIYSYAVKFVSPSVHETNINKFKAPYDHHTLEWSNSIRVRGRGELVDAFNHDFSTIIKNQTVERRAWLQITIVPLHRKFSCAPIIRLFENLIIESLVHIQCVEV